MWDESIALQHDEEREQDREARDTQRYDHDEHVPTTYERAQFNEEEEQAIYERDDKMGAI